MDEWEGSVTLILWTLPGLRTSTVVGTKKWDDVSVGPWVSHWTRGLIPWFGVPTSQTSLVPPGRPVLVEEDGTFLQG